MRGLALALIASAAPTASGSSQQLPAMPGDLLVLDGLADRLGTGGFGSVFGVDLAQPVGAGCRTVAGNSELLDPSAISVHCSGALLVCDLSADPSDHGPDPWCQRNGCTAGRGAIFLIDSVTGAVLQTVTDAGWADPFGVEALADGRALMVDRDADPSGFGDDLAGYPGSGAAYVIQGDGTVSILSDGSDYVTDALPPGRASIFQDPIAVAVSAAGVAYVLDAAADPLDVDPSHVDLDFFPALFELDLVSGAVSLVAADPLWNDVIDIAVEPDGDVLVLDLGSDILGRPGLFRVDVGNPDPVANSTLLVAPEVWVDPLGVAVAADGAAYVVDASADPLERGYFGAVFRVDRATGVVSLVRSSPDFRLPVNIAGVPDASVYWVEPGPLAPGERTFVTLRGGTFTSCATPSFDPPDVTVHSWEIVSGTEIVVDISVPVTAGCATRTVSVSNGALGLTVETADLAISDDPATPDEVSVPGAAMPLTWASKDTLVWEAAAASRACAFSIYRGGLAELHAGTLGSCLASGMVEPAFTDVATPGSDRGWFYLVAGRTAGGEGSLGMDSRGGARLSASACP